MVEQIFKINFKNHEHKLSAEKIGNCIISGKHYIGEIEIEDIDVDEKYNQLLEQHKALQEAYIKLGGGGVVDGNVVDAISEGSFLTYRDIAKYIDSETKLIGLREGKPSSWKFIGYIYDSQGKPKQFLVHEGD